MRELLTEAQQRGLSAEIYWTTREPLSVRFEGGQPSTAMQDCVDQCAIRVIREGRLGMACGSRPDRTVLAAAEEAARRGAQTSLTFASHASTITQQVSAPQADTQAEELLETAAELHSSVLTERPEIALVVHANRHREIVRIATTEGFEAEQTLTYATVTVSAPFHEAGSRVWKTRLLEGNTAGLQALAEEFLLWYGWGDRISAPPAGRLPVLLAPEGSFLLSMPLMAALSGEALHQQTSPLEGKLNQQIVGEELTVMDAPLSADASVARRFDDEGTPCMERPLVERGVLKGYLFDRRTAGLLSQRPTGNGFKRALFGGGPWEAPNPWPARLSVSRGDMGWRDLLAGVDQGLLLYGGMGFHSANYLQGNFSVQALGYHVENGAVRGRLHGVMVAGNIYEDLHGVAVSEEMLQLPDYGCPYILVPELQVAHGG